MNETLIPELIAVSSELRLANANEATTRFKLIDALLIDLLGWNKTDIRIEERVTGEENSTFVDYIISAGAHSFLIEAKRVGRFKNDFPTFRKGKLSDNWAKRTEVKKAIDQAIEYGRLKSVGFCIITDGINWAIFPINRRDQVTISDSLAVIFSNIKFSDRETVQDFESLLSRSAVLDGSLNRELLEQRETK